MLMREINAFCRSAKISFTEWENLRWGEYLEMHLAHVLNQKQIEKEMKKK
jgi:hypothetical protein